MCSTGQHSTGLSKLNPGTSPRMHCTSIPTDYRKPSGGILGDSPFKGGELPGTTLLKLTFLCEITGTCPQSLQPQCTALWRRQALYTGIQSWFKNKIVPIFIINPPIVYYSKIKVQIQKAKSLKLKIFLPTKISVDFTFITHCPTSSLLRGTESIILW